MDVILVTVARTQTHKFDVHQLVSLTSEMSCQAIQLLELAPNLTVQPDLISYSAAMNDAWRGERNPLKDQEGLWLGLGAKQS